MPVSPTNGYCTGGELKAALGISAVDVEDDAALERAIETASRIVDRWCGRRFWQDPADTTRYFTPDDWRTLTLHGSPGDVEVVTVTSVTVDTTGNGTYGETLVEGTDFLLAPRSAAANGRPYRRLEMLRTSGRVWPVHVTESVKVVGRFGWSAVPEDIVEATVIQASRVFKRVREAPFGVASLSLEGEGIRLTARLDPDVELLLRPWRLVSGMVG